LATGALVTVVLPTYNRAASLHRAIASVLVQEYTALELIILDDCSTDDTPAIVKEFRDPRVTSIRHPANLGLVGNWSFGVLNAHGEYLAVLGDDDRYEPGFLQRRIDGFAAHPDVAAVTGGFLCCDAKGAAVRSSRAPVAAPHILGGEELWRFCCGASGEWYNGATLYRTALLRSLWDKVAMAGYALDQSLHVRLCLPPSSRVLYLPGADMVLRVHPGQESRKSGIRLAECAAKSAMQLWQFDMGYASREARRLFRKRGTQDINHYGRMLWDRGSVRQSRDAFRLALSLNPLCGESWLRFLRSCLRRPRRIFDQGS
jgi:glycosyltransferase involved in cell wall biosynthesis